MKILKRSLFWVAAIIIVTVVAAAGYLRFVLPDVGDAPDLNVERTAERVARGEYLANHVTVCMDCHSTRDWTKFSGPIVPGTLGKGGELFDSKMGFPGTYYASDITPAGISRYTDGELFRLITTGVNKEGKAIFPVMPYHHYGRMSMEDIESIIAYIRTLPPIKNNVPASKSDFPMNFLINTIPTKADLTEIPDKTDMVKYGGYMTNAAGCVDCHTQVSNGKPVKGMEFGGGREFPLPDGYIVRSANISSDKETGLGAWTSDQFVTLFRMLSDSLVLNTKLQPGKHNSLMPWTMYGSMEENDLRAIFAYLQTTRPVRNRVEKYSDAHEVTVSGK